jgi:cytidyltransferase-like protein
MKVGICSGYFNPVHIGHLDYLQAARAACDFLIVIVNNDKQVALKGGKFMDEVNRVAVISAIRYVELAILSIDNGKSIVNTLHYLRNELIDYDLILFNSGDRSPDNFDSSESTYCKMKKIREVFLDLPKVESSSAIKMASGLIIDPVVQV